MHIKHYETSKKQTQDRQSSYTPVIMYTFRRKSKQNERKIPFSFTRKSIPQKHSMSFSFYFHCIFLHLNRSFNFYTAKTRFNLSRTKNHSAEETLFFSAHHSGNLCTSAEKRPENGRQTYSPGTFFLYLERFPRQKQNIRLTGKHRHMLALQPSAYSKTYFPTDFVTGQSHISLTIRFRLPA